MTRNPGQRRSVITYKIGKKEVTAQEFAQKTGAPLTTSSGQATALGKDVGVELPKGAKVDIIKEGEGGKLVKSIYNFEWGNDER